MKRFQLGTITALAVLAGGFTLIRPAIAAAGPRTPTAPTMVNTVKMIKVIKMEATAYGPSAQDNYPYGATDYFGRPLAAGDVAVDPRVIPLNTCIRVTGYTSPNLPAGGFTGVADDEGGAVSGRHVDIFLNASKTAVENFGVQTVSVTVLGPANPHETGLAACRAYDAQQPVGAAPPVISRSAVTGLSHRVASVRLWIRP